MLERFFDNRFCRIMFNGLWNYVYFRKENIPMHFYREWLWEKFKADLKLVLWLLAAFPYVILALIATGAYLISEAFDALKNMLPDWLFLGDYRKKQIAVVDRIKQFKRDKQNNAG